MIQTGARQHLKVILLYSGCLSCRDLGTAGLLVGLGKRLKALVPPQLLLVRELWMPWLETVIDRVRSLVD